MNRTTVAVVLVVLVLSLLVVAAFLTFIGWEPVASITTGIITTASSAIQDAPGKIWTALTGVGAGIAAVGVKVASMIQAQKAAVVKAQTEYKTLEGDARKIMAENQEHVDTLQKQGDTLKANAADLKEKAQTIANQKQLLDANQITIKSLQDQLQGISRIKTVDETKVAQMIQQAANVP